jgi:hypothetical protein
LVRERIQIKMGLVLGDGFLNCGENGMRDQGRRQYRLQEITYEIRDSNRIAMARQVDRPQKVQ